MAVEQELSNLAHCIDDYGSDDRMTILQKYNNFNKTEDGNIIILS